MQSGVMTPPQSGSRLALARPALASGQMVRILGIPVAVSELVKVRCWVMTSGCPSSMRKAATGCSPEFEASHTSPPAQVSPPSALYQHTVSDVGLLNPAITKITSDGPTFKPNPL